MSFRCEKCEAKFDRQYVYEKHLKRKTPCDKIVEPDPDAEFSCKHCGRSLSTERSLVRHYKTCKMRKSKNSLDRRLLLDKIENKLDVSKKIKVEDGTKIIDMTMTVNYVYLIKEREFIKTGEDVYKLGRSKKENHKRFNQYPKGSILLFQIICNDCVDMEKQLIKIFKESFKQRKDVGREYFEGNHVDMIDIIYSTAKKDICSDSKK
jgi:hypothetical protein